MCPKAHDNLTAPQGLGPGSDTARGTGDLCCCHEDGDVTSPAQHAVRVTAGSTAAVGVKLTARTEERKGNQRRAAQTEGSDLNPVLLVLG